MRNILIGLCTIVFLFATYNDCYAQDDNSQVSTQYSPDAYAATMLKNVPMNPFTGKLNWKASLFSKKMSVLNFSLQLVYLGGGGIKVDDPGSCYGKGWALQFGGSIIRTVRGEPDEMSQNFDTDTGYTSANLFNEGPLVDIADGVYGVSYDAESTNFQVNNYASGGRDSQHDIFEYSLPNGESGQFYIGQDQQILSVSNNGLKIIPHFNPDSYDSLDAFKIIDEAGNVYYFNQAEITTSVFNSAWLLTRMEAPSGEEAVNFTYNTLYSGFEDYSQTITDNNVQTIDIPTSMYPRSTPTNYYNVQTISFSDSTKIKFYYGPQGYSGTVGDLSSIGIYSDNGSLIKSYLFDYLYWYNPGSGPMCYYTEGATEYYGTSENMYLRTVKEQGSSGSISNLYTFDYYLGLNLNENSFSLDMDIWGYHNGKNNQNLWLGLPEASPGDRSVDFNYTVMGALKGVVYKTGAFEHYVYEPNQKRINNGSQTIGGIRLKARYFYANQNDQNPLAARFNYVETDGISSGFLGDQPVFNDTLNVYDQNWPTQKNIYYSYHYSSSEPINPLASVDGSSSGYRRVEEVISDSTNLTSSGKIVYEYSDLSYVTPGLWAPINTFPYRPVDRPTWAVGLPVKTTYYSSNGSIAKQITNQYNITQSLVYGENYHSIYVSQEGSNSVGVLGQAIYKVVNYYPIQGRSKLIKTTETDYSTVNPASFTTNVTQYQYEPTYSFLRQKTSSTYRGDSVRQVTYYPFDYHLGGGSFTSNMVSANMLNAPVSEESFIEKSGTYYLTGATATAYSTSGIIRPVNNYSSRLTQPVSGISPSSFNPATLLQSGANMTLALSNLYDNKGRLIEQTNEAGAKKAFLLNNRSEIIGESVNAAFNSVAYTSFEDDEDLSNWSYNESSITSGGAYSGLKCYNGTIGRSGLPSGNYIVSLRAKGSSSITINGVSQDVSAQWQLYTTTLNGITSVSINTNGNEIDDIRIFPAASQLTTKVYQGGVGLISETDATGNNSRLQYDDLNRVKNQLDQSGNIIKNYAYHDLPPLYTSSQASQTYSAGTLPCPYQSVSNSSVTLSVPAGKYSSYLSKADADAKAQSDLATNALWYAKNSGGCLPEYYNTQASQNFTKNNCGSGDVTPTAWAYTVFAGEYMSLVSQADADSKAQADIAANGQNAANANGQCLYPTTVNFTNNTSYTFTITFSTLFSNSALPDYTYTCPPGSSSFNVPGYSEYYVYVDVSSGTTVQDYIGVTTDNNTNPLQVGGAGGTAVFRSFDVTSDNDFYFNILN